MSTDNAKVSLLQSPLRPQAKVLLSVSVEHGVIATSAFGLTATQPCQTMSSLCALYMLTCLAEPSASCTAPCLVRTASPADYASSYT